jgi:ATP/maltotriose-dependent transcriptional regulator MalT
VAIAWSSRSTEERSVTDFLRAASSEPSALVIEGEPGIGKSTVWLGAIDKAREAGFVVLSTYPAAAESVLAYSALADLLGGSDPAVVARLPAPQRLAVDQVLLRGTSDGSGTDQRAVAAGFVSIIEDLAGDAPVLLAIDDLQWVDQSSAHVVAFAARRLLGPVGVLATARTQPDGDDPAFWLQLRHPNAVRRIHIGPMGLGGLRAVIDARLGRSFPRPVMTRIHDASGGNPFYALELARTLNDDAMTATGLTLPGSLAALVSARLGNLDADVQELLLAAACLGAPTVALVAAATNRDPTDALALLEAAEDQGVVGIDGARLHFTHPLLATGVYAAASPARRRRMHRLLAGVVSDPELQARHLALAATSGDEKTLTALDAAAKLARRRGAPAAAAELVDLAVSLGGDTPRRRIRSARNHLDAGHPDRARALLQETIEALPPGTLRAEALNMLALVALYHDSFLEAEQILERALDDVGDHLPLRAQTLLTLSFSLLNHGHLVAALRAAEDAVTHAERLGYPPLLSQALGMAVHLRFRLGEGLDESSLHRALQLEDPDIYMPAVLRPSLQNALLLSWSGELDQAYEKFVSIRRRCVEHGEENELILVAFNLCQIEIWRGHLPEATLIAEDSVEAALLQGGDLALGVALTTRATVAAYAGREDDARVDAAAALTACQRCGARVVGQLPVIALAFLEVSLGNYSAALHTLEPLLAALDTAPRATEISAAGAAVPDAVEAMIALGRRAEAETLIERLEANGRRLDRPWMLAVGARCRAMLLAAGGDVDAAAATAQAAMREHERLPMPFERARTQLLVGQLLRRQRQKSAASTQLREALNTFENLGTPLWAERARTQLARINVGTDNGAGLTPTEQRVAELAASGMTNRDTAAALFISPKTVEANLARIYHKLNIHSRTELRHLLGPGHGNR